MNNQVPARKVNRSASEYINSAIWLFSGSIILCLLSLNWIESSNFLLGFLVFAFLHACKLILMIYRPLMKIDQECLTAYPNIFNKTVIRVDDIKNLQLYEVIDKMILRQRQFEQNNTLIVNLVDGKAIPLQLSGLTKSVRKNIAVLAEESNISFAYQKANEV